MPRIPPDTKQPPSLEPDSRATSVVCLHGLRRTPGDWDAVRAGLEPYGTVRAPSLPGEPGPALDRADSAVRDGDIVIGHSMGGILALRLARERGRLLRGIVLTGCFFPPARNGRSLAASVGDYAAHRAAFLRGRGPRGGEARSPGSARALTSLMRLAVRRDQAAVRAPVLVVHARDDHHVPVDFALAATAGRPGWAIKVHDRGGHHLHVNRPEQWLASVTSWLDALEARIPG